MYFLSYVSSKALHLPQQGDVRDARLPSLSKQAVDAFGKTLRKFLHLK